MEAIFPTELAIDGQSYVGYSPFQYILPYGVALAYPSLGPANGGTTIMLEGKDLIETSLFPNLLVL